MASAAPEISIVIPVYNEEANLEVLFGEIIDTMEQYGRSFEMIAVDDGSTDGSYSILEKLHQNDRRLRVVRLLRNFGQHPATYAGFQQVRGRIVVTIDADLQNPPSEIPKVIDKLEEGYDVVQGWREGRQDHFLRKLASRSVNRLVSYLTGFTIRDVGCALKAFRREAVELLTSSTHSSRYIPAETAWLGLKLGEVKVAHRPRVGGESKYGLVALLRVNFDMIASISTLPIKIIGPVGLIFGLIGIAMSLRVVYVRLIYGDTNAMGTVVAIFFFLAGVQMFSTAVMCEYISRTYTETQRRPYFLIKDTLEDSE